LGVAMPPKQDIRKQRREQILDASSKVFAEKGVHDSRMDDIVEESGLSKGALYWYFKSKDEILIAIFERMFIREFNQLKTLANQDGCSTDKILSFIESTLKEIKQMQRLMPIAYEFMSLAFRRKFIRDSFKKYINTYVEELNPIIQQGIDSGEFRQVNSQEIVIAIGAIIEGTILLWVYDRNLVSPQVHIKSGITFILDGIKQTI
jgi:AcrR family transcriptional regulator